MNSVRSIDLASVVAGSRCERRAPYVSVFSASRIRITQEDIENSGPLRKRGSFSIARLLNRTENANLPRRIHGLHRRRTGSRGSTGYGRREERRPPGQHSGHSLVVQLGERFDARLVGERFNQAVRLAKQEPLTVVGILVRTKPALRSFFQSLFSGEIF